MPRKAPFKNYGRPCARTVFPAPKTCPSRREVRLDGQGPELVLQRSTLRARMRLNQVNDGTGFTSVSHASDADQRVKTPEDYHNHIAGKHIEHCCIFVVTLANIARNARDVAFQVVLSGPRFRSRRPLQVERVLARPHGPRKFVSRARWLLPAMSWRPTGCDSSDALDHLDEPAFA